MDPWDLSHHDQYRPRKGIEEVAAELNRDSDEFIKLSSNGNPLGPSPAAIAAVRDFADGAHQYPTAVHADLREALAAEWNLTSAQVWLGNGGDGVLNYLARAFLDPGDSVLVPHPGFAYYGMSARYRDVAVNHYPLRKATEFEQSADIVLEAYAGERVIYLTTPHNPTGSTMPLQDIRRIARETDQRTLVVVDEAYGRFADQPSAVRLLNERTDVTVTRTSSKVYGLAGLRLGYGLVPEAWADVYAQVNTPFTVSGVACRAGLAALHDTQHVESTIETVRWSREYLSDKLKAKTWPNHGNFVLVEVGDGIAVTEALQRHGSSFATRLVSASQPVFVFHVGLRNRQRT